MRVNLREATVLLDGQHQTHFETIANKIDKLANKICVGHKRREGELGNLIEGSGAAGPSIGAHP